MPIAEVRGRCGLDWAHGERTLLFGAPPRVKGRRGRRRCGRRKCSRRGRRGCHGAGGGGHGGGGGDGQVEGRRWQGCLGGGHTGDRRVVRPRPPACSRECSERPPAWRQGALDLGHFGGGGPERLVRLRLRLLRVPVHLLHEGVEEGRMVVLVGQRAASRPPKAPAHAMMISSAGRSGAVSSEPRSGGGRPSRAPVGAAAAAGEDARV
mmetsp:Transcript_65008/g.146659  ORF Transcript_65008/g.146659 Transcript_65008/m.146659 type:complete len:208 (+) Transcript_65008:168-791(+)